MIAQLMNRNPLERLGRNGAGEIKQHPFFLTIDWEQALRRYMYLIKSIDN